MRTYEVLFILSPQVPEEEATTLINDFRGIAEKTGATLKNEEAWGRRRLAYTIDKFNEGNYHLFVFETEGALSELDRRMKNVDRVLRHLIVRTDLDHKRADKLAAKNPKKERVRAVPASFSPDAMTSAPEGASSPEAVSSPDPSSDAASTPSAGGPMAYEAPAGAGNDTPADAGDETPQA